MVKSHDVKSTEFDICQCINQWFIMVKSHDVKSTEFYICQCINEWFIKTKQEKWITNSQCSPNYFYFSNWNDTLHDPPC